MKPERSKQSLTDASAVRVPARAPTWVIPSVKTALVVIDLALAAQHLEKLAVHALPRYRVGLLATNGTSRPRLASHPRRVLMTELLFTRQGTPSPRAPDRPNWPASQTGSSWSHHRCRRQPGWLQPPGP